jgi:tetratricopeptide (TPR) repeat protein
MVIPFRSRFEIGGRAGPGHFGYRIGSQEAHMRKTTVLALSLASLAFLASPGPAAASGSTQMPRVQAPTPSPEQEAVEHYNDGVTSREKADKFEAETAAESDAAKKAKLLEKSRSQHETSIKKNLKAVAKDPRMFQAWGSLGYAYRKTGNLPAALEAYDKALALE